MDHYKLVLPEHLNHHGTLFGGYLLMWIDELTYITANLECPGNRFVTIGLDRVEFRHSIAGGEILKLSINRERIGTTSVSYRAQVYGTRLYGTTKTVLFETGLTLVNVNASGRKEAIHPPRPGGSPDST